MTHEQWIETQGVLAPGALLPNGWTVIDAVAELDTAVVLAVSSDSAYPYATWFARLTDVGWDTYWGDYHADLASATASFQHRSGR